MSNNKQVNQNDSSAIDAGVGAGASKQAYDSEEWSNILSNPIVKRWGGIHQFMLSNGLELGNDGAYELACLIIDEIERYEWNKRIGEI